MAKTVSVTTFRPTVVRGGKRTKTKIWWLAWRDPVTRKPKRKSSDTEDAVAARGIAADLSRRLTSGQTDPFAKHDGTTWAAVTAAFMAELDKKVGIGDREATSIETVGVYRDTIAAVTRVLNPNLLTEIDTAAVERFALDRGSETEMPWRAAKLISRLELAAAWMQETQQPLTAESIAEYGGSRARKAALRIACKWSQMNGPITAVAIDQLAVKHRKRVAKPVTINKQLRHLRSILRWAQRHFYIRDVPVFKKAFQREPIKTPEVIRPEEINACLAALDDGRVRLFQQPAEWWRVFIALSFSLGSRRGETLGIRWGSVDWEQQKVTITPTTSKGRRGRTCDLMPDVIEDLQQWWLHCGKPGPAELVVPWAADLRALYPEWHRIRKAAGITRRVIPHNCRSSRATLMIEQGASLRMAQVQLGHASYKTTEGAYGAVGDAAKRAAVEASWTPLHKKSG